MLGSFLLNWATRVYDIYTSAGLPDTPSSSLAANIKNLIFVVAGVVVVYFLSLGGYKYTTSGGNPEEAKKATQTIVYACLGLFIILSSYVIVTWVFGIGKSI
jgi:hypothetical protein